MVSDLTVDPTKLQQFGDPQGSIFCLVTNPGLEDQITVVEGGEYEDYVTALLEPGEHFEDILEKRIPAPAHILAISPNAFFESPSPEALGPRRKLMGMACNSTPTSMDVIRHFMGVMERTSPVEQDRFSDAFFERLESADYLVYVDEKRGTRATLQHLDDDLVWNQQALARLGRAADSAVR